MNVEFGMNAKKIGETGASTPLSFNFHGTSRDSTCPLQMVGLSFYHRWWIDDEWVCFIWILDSGFSAREILEYLDWIVLIGSSRLFNRQLARQEDLLQSAGCSISIRISIGKGKTRLH